MIKLKNILKEVLNTYIVQAYILTDSGYNITDVLDGIRAVRKVTIIRNITPPEYAQKENMEYTLVTIKFISRGNPKQDLEQLKQDIVTSDRSITDLRVPGIKSFNFKRETLQRI
jgi:hypothetical protein